MVWSDSSSYPFQVFDANGTLVAQLDADGLTVYDATNPARFIQMSPNGAPGGTSILRFDDGLGDVAEIYYAHPPSTPYDYGLLIDDNREWTAFPITGNWTMVNSVEYRADALGNIMLRGIPRYTPAAVIPDGTLLGTLPLYYRPPQDFLTTICYDVITTKGRVLIRTNGDVEFYDAGNRFPSLDGVLFSSLI
jgi:hypothetical protein